VPRDDRCFEQHLLSLQLSGFDALRNLDFLLARRQRNLAHLLEVHPDRIVEDVILRRAGLLFLRLLLALLERFDLLRLDDLDVEVLEDGQNVIDLVLVLDGIRQRLVDVVEGQVTLFLGLADAGDGFSR
jgi:hypothetical protein